MKKFLTAMSMLLLAANIQAASLSGKIQLTGYAMAYDDLNTVETIDGIDMLEVTPGWPPIVGGPSWGTAGDVYVSAVVGGFADVVSTGDLGKMSDIDLSSSSISPLWTVGGLSFTLDSFTFNKINSGLEIVGKGTLMAAGYEATSGTFRWNITNIDSQTAFLFDSTTVSEPGVLALFGLGLLGLGMMRAKSKKS